MTFLVEIILAILFEVVVVRSPALGAGLWAVLAAFLVRRAFVLLERTHLVVTACGDLLGGVGAAMLALSAWRGHIVITEPDRWPWYAPIWLAAFFVLEVAGAYMKRDEQARIEKAMANASVWDRVTMAAVPDLRDGCGVHPTASPNRGQRRR